ncbi:MAG: peptidylprolyl isomerase [Bacteroidales bacterium]|nr:peptidylprolyl isomerase [Bacteroidales bacterium]MDD2425227.1 peptidylprolyl isomerase [Bacteroidales bacterium]MDD3989936.1 peptidylprolyl isomerase [Bacteroidales bacterium]MDD4638821.1 peptidylprolyl isomerase [Bacteroidales bacterium]
MNKSIFKLLIIIPISLYSCKGKKSVEQDQEQIKTTDTLTMETQQLFNPADLPEEPVFDIITTMGTIRIKLYKETPKHRDNFVKLASEGYYNNILFHRVINGFMIQTGDPLTKDTLNSDKFGTGGPGYNVPAEILPQFNHKKGALAAARRGDQANPQRESSGSQFYLVQDPQACKQLDGAYTVFGETITGENVIDLIASVPVNHRDRPLNDVKIISITPVRESR